MEKSVKVGIITGVAASMVFVYLLDPIIKVFGEFIVYSSEYVTNGLIDTIYAKSALGIARDPALSIYAMISGFAVGIPAGTIAFLIKSKIKDTSNHSKKKTSRYNDVLLLIPALFISFMMFYQFWSMTFQYEVISSFNQHIKILTPYMTSKEKDLVISNFSRMKSEKDYRTIYNNLQSRAQKEDIELPENLTYSMWAI